MHTGNSKSSGKAIKPVCTLLNGTVFLKLCMLWGTHVPSAVPIHLLTSFFNPIVYFVSLFRLY